MDEKEKILILSVGGSPEPLIYSINEFKPNKVVFLHSPQTLKEAHEVLGETNFDSLNTEFYEIPDAETLDDSFSVSKKVFSKFKDTNLYDVKVDFTGGTKPMVSGIVLAVVEGNFANFKFSYVGSKDSESRNKNGVGIVKDGSEITKMQINPYKKYAITEFKRGKNFFNTYQFEAALKNFKNAEMQLEDGNLKELATYYIKLVNFYQSWDKFNSKLKVLNEKTDEEEKIRLNSYLQKELIEKCPTAIFKEDFSNYEKFINQMKYNLDFLRLKLSNDINKGIEYYLPDLLNNAYRKIEMGHYDDAVARLYRAIELIAQINLNRLGLIDQDKLKQNKVFHINKKQFMKVTDDNRKARSKVVRWHLSDYEDPESKTFRITLAKNYDLLKSFEIPVAFDYFSDIKLIRSKDKRNNSILAHGLEPLDYDSTIDFYNKVLEFSLKSFPDIKKYMDLAEFPKFE